MGTTESSSIVNSKSSIGGLVVPAFLKSMSRFILAILVVGGSYFTVSEGLRFFAERWNAFIAAEIEQQIGDFNFTLGQNKVEGIENMSVKELQKVLYLTGEKLTSCQMGMASIEEISKGAR